MGRASDGKWWLGRNVNGTNLTTSRYGEWNEAAEWRDVLVANFAGDDRPDIAGRASNGQWWVAINTGTGLDVQFFAQWTEVAWEDVLAANFTGSGYADVVGRITGEWWIGASNGTSFATRSFVKWSGTAGWHDGRAGNVFNGSGADNAASEEVLPVGSPTHADVTYAAAAPVVLRTAAVTVLDLAAGAGVAFYRADGVFVGFGALSADGSAWAVAFPADAEPTPVYAVATTAGGRVSDPFLADLG